MTTLPTFHARSTADEVVEAFASDIKSKNVLVTGTSLNGIGFETARAIAKYANLVVITGYNEERLQLSKDAILKIHPAANVRTLLLDLSSFAAVRKAAAEVNAYPETLHVLINNAMPTSGVYSLTEDNIEIQMAGGHIGPFLFTNLLLPKMLAADPSISGSLPRVVFVSSIGHRQHNGVPIDYKDEFLRGKPGLTPLVRYGQVKSANVLTARQLARRGRGRLEAFSLHPGGIWTNVFDGGLYPELKAVGLVNDDGSRNEDFPGGWKTLSQGAATTLIAAFDPRISEHSGAYLDDSVVAEDKCAPHSADMTRARKLWELTEDVIGEKFEW
ncbi:Short-chain dehydrogenase/reductase family protein [Mycena chlorophos]|uniref:Short-chain dehydrogenase/reductase family protein n=1 Tax=Mycena chlorophos TaxID=658473 RepID=A0A8H6SJQ9_MYCCL|nr:Short-chain dehydrogenase/reductase family protein [Mycena chlorophos]